MPAAFFGMNLRSGLEEVEGLFPLVVATCGVLSLGVLTGLVFIYIHWPKRMDRRRAEVGGGMGSFTLHYKTWGRTHFLIGHWGDVLRRCWIWHMFMFLPGFRALGFRIQFLKFRVLRIQKIRFQDIRCAASG